MTVERHDSVILSKLIDSLNGQPELARIALFQLKSAEYYHDNSKFKLTMINLEPFKGFLHLDAYRLVLIDITLVNKALSLLFKECRCV